MAKPPSRCGRQHCWAPSRFHTAQPTSFSWARTRPWRREIVYAEIHHEIKASPYTINTHPFLTDMDWYWLRKYHTYNFVRSVWQRVPWGLATNTYSGILCGKTLGRRHGRLWSNYPSTPALAGYFIQRSNILGRDQRSLPRRMDPRHWR